MRKSVVGVAALLLTLAFIISLMMRDAAAATGQCGNEHKEHCLITATSSIILNHSASGCIFQNGSTCQKEYGYCQLEEWVSYRECLKATPTCEFAYDWGACRNTSSVCDDWFNRQYCPIPRQWNWVRHTIAGPTEPQWRVNMSKLSYNFTHMWMPVASVITINAAGTKMYGQDNSNDMIFEIDIASGVWTPLANISTSSNAITWLHDGETLLLVNSWLVSFNTSSNELVYESTMPITQRSLAIDTENANDKAIYSAGSFGVYWLSSDFSTKHLIVGHITSYGYVDSATPTEVRFYFAQAIVVKNGIMFIADRYSVRKFDLTTNVTTTVAGGGSRDTLKTDGTGTGAGFEMNGAIVYVDDNLYVLDDNVLRQITISGGVVTTLSSKQNGRSVYGALSAAAFGLMQGADAPYSVAYKASLMRLGTALYAATTAGEMFKIEDITATTPMVSSVVMLPAGGAYQTTSTPRFSRPTHVVRRSDGTFLVSDFSTVRILSRDGAVTRTNGTFGAAFERHTNPSHLTLDESDNAFYWHTYRVYKISAATDTPTHYALAGKAFKPEMGTLLTTKLGRITAMCYGFSVGLFAYEHFNKTWVLMTSSGVQYVAGRGSAFTYDPPDGEGHLAGFGWNIHSCVYDKIASIYIAESKIIRKMGVTSPYTVSTVIGESWSTSATPFQILKGIAYDASIDMLYVSDVKASAIYSVRPGSLGKLATDTRLILGGTFGFQGDQDLEHLNQPHGLTVDDDGNLYFVDTYNHQGVVMLNQTSRTATASASVSRPETKSPSLASTRTRKTQTRTRKTQSSSFPPTSTRSRTGTEPLTKSIDSTRSNTHTVGRSPSVSRSSEHSSSLSPTLKQTRSRTIPPPTKNCSGVMATFSGSNYYFPPAACVGNESTVESCTATFDTCLRSAVNCSEVNQCFHSRTLCLVAISGMVSETQSCAAWRDGFIGAVLALAAGGSYHDSDLHKACDYGLCFANEYAKVSHHNKKTSAGDVCVAEFDAVCSRTPDVQTPTRGPTQPEFTLTFNGSAWNDVLGAAPPGSAEHRAIETALATDLSKVLGVPVWLIAITELRAGSLIVKFIVRDDPSGQTPPTNFGTVIAKLDSFVSEDSNTTAEAFANLRNTTGIQPTVSAAAVDFSTPTLEPSSSSPSPTSNSTNTSLTSSSEALPASWITTTSFCIMLFFFAF